MTCRPSRTPPSRLFSRSQLSDHPLNLDKLLSIRLVTKQFQRIQISGLDRFFACLGNQPTLDPHLNPLRRL